MMYAPVEYQMSNQDLEAILDACKPTPFMMIGNYSPSSPQENANNAWRKLGEQMGFDHLTVRPVHGKGQRFFTAVPSESDEARKERVTREKEERRKQDLQVAEYELKMAQEKVDLLREKQTTTELTP